MPNPYNSNSPYQAAQAFSGLGPALDNIVLGLAQQRYQMAKQKEEMQFRREQAMAENLARQQQLDLTRQHYGEQAKRYAAQNAVDAQNVGDKQNLRSLGVQAGMLAEGAVNTPQDNPMTQQLLQSLIANNVAQQGAAGRRFAPEVMAQTQLASTPLGQLAVGLGDVNKGYVKVGSGQTAFSPLGMQTYQGGYTVPQGAQRFAPQVGISLEPQQPVATGLPPSESSFSHEDRSLNALTRWIESTRNPLTGEVDPALVDQVNKARTIGGDIVNRLGQGGGRQAQGGSDRVSVISPDGKRGSIPRAQLNEALKSGYKQVQ